MLSDLCEIKNEVSTTWSMGAIEKAQELITEAVKIYFAPIAMLSTKTNDVVSMLTILAYSCLFFYNLRLLSTKI